MKYLLLFMMCIPLISISQNYRVQSPDGKIVVTSGTGGSFPFWYSVSVNGSEIIRESGIGFQVNGTQLPGNDAKVVSAHISEVKKSWKPVYGERSAVTDHYNQLKITLKGNNLPSGKCEITYRVYNEGVAYNCTFLAAHANDSLRIQKETTAFNFPENHDCWVSERAQSEIFKTKVSSVTKPVDRPVLVEAGEYRLAIGEARLVDFARMKLIAGKNENSLMTTIDGEAAVKLPYTMPWRTIMIGRTEGELLANNFFYEMCRG
jgi:alpha-glucosidase